MEFAVCYDHSGTELARSIFLHITAFLVILAPLAAGAADHDIARGFRRAASDRVTA
ncbi:hypothetical protein [Mesorhizobium sp. WSM4904]|uniref:hypothetical protein n=1 Tax=Mesorhizobium sp. WSM4904 TaxID=3038545 RepID=UPI002418B4A8|nr:hypothetical protein [Mesorhizobium sp. WSM4904]WFP61735.1 hypothetical protein QAZ47_25160 [Mesorhizobium sp. WSM4904]